MGPFETIYINETVAVCNGGEGALGHPRVYLNLAPAGKVECPYCSRLFVNRAMQPPSAGEAATRPDASEPRNA
ncbi:MAG TPA: zinc-finger domain-containing protein [Stellaceae bacterium]|nr:zinc-finger domain-containing protein [Stellaceae bacterium]HMD66158.1 zinc-finger domain-containing protein [Stellaceae bacterium]